LPSPQITDKSYLLVLTEKSDFGILWLIANINLKNTITLIGSPALDTPHSLNLPPRLNHSNHTSPVLDGTED
jgi:hypothetical protein